MRFLVFLFLSLGPRTNIQAQQADSLQSQPDSAVTPSLGLFKQRLFAFYEHVPGQVLFHPANSYSLSSIGMAHSKGAWRTPQISEKSTQYQVASKGVSQINTIKVWGDFAYTRSREDSIGWRLKPDQDDPSPYYLGNIRPGNWDSHDYQLKGAGAAAITSRLHVVAGVQMHVGTYGRYNDPRPEVSRYRLKLEGGLGYQVQKTKVVVSGRYGYGDERNRVGYQNPMNSSEGRPTYLTYDLMGYGFYRLVAGPDYNLREDQKTVGISAVVQHGAFNLAYSYQRVTREYTRQLSRTNETRPVGEVGQREHGLVSSYTWATQGVERLVGTEMQYVQLKDFNQILIQGNNFLGLSKDAAFFYFEKRKTWEYGASIAYQSVSRKDGTAAVDYRVQTASAKAEAQTHISVKLGFLQIGAQVAYRTDLGSKLTIGSQYNDFMRGVVLPDFTYYSSRQLEPGVSLGYGIKVKNVLLLPTFGYQLQRALSPEQVEGATYQPNRSRSSYLVQLNVHL